MEPGDRFINTEADIMMMELVARFLRVIILSRMGKLSGVLDERRAFDSQGRIR